MSFRHRNLLWENRKNLFWGACLLVVTDLLVLVFPMLVKWVIDRLNHDPLPSWLPKFISDLHPLWFAGFVCILLISISALSVVTRYYWRVYMVWTFFPKIHELRKALFFHLSRLPASFYRKHKSGDLISSLSEDTEKIRMTLSMGSLAVVDTIINFLIFPLMLWVLSPRLTMIVIPFLILCSLFFVFISSRLNSLYEKIQDQIAEISGRAFEITFNARVIKAFSKEKHFENVFSKASHKLAKTAGKLAYFQSIMGPGLHLSLGLAMSFALIYGGLEVFQDRMSVSDLIAFELYLGKLDWPIIAIGWFVDMWRKSRASKIRINSIFAETKFGVNTQDQLIEFRQDRPVFQLENLGYSYPNRPALFSNLNFHLERGNWYGLTGPVGSGKSTLLQILSCQLWPTEGRLEFMGHDIRHIDPEIMESHCLYIPQDVYLFSQTLRSNLLFGVDEPTLTDDELINLLKDMKFDISNLMKRGGLWTRLGEKGTNVSGGQKQRLALARSLIRKRSVYLFDDVFSHVDAETREGLIKVLKSRLPSDACVILVSQDLGTLSYCNEILVLSESCLSFKGSFESALKESAFINRLDFLQRKFKSIA